MAGVAIPSYPFTSDTDFDPTTGIPSFDRAVGAEFMRKFYMVERTNGVIKKDDVNSFKVSAATSGGMHVDVAPGKCFINGAYGLTDTKKTLTVETAHPTLPRIDLVVLRLDLRHDYRAILLDVLKGTPAFSPVPPTLTQNAEIWEISIASLQINAASSTIPSSRITDTRPESTMGTDIPLPLPINQGGTGATTKSGAIGNLGLTGVATKTLLWTNASPGSDFVEQYIYLDLSNFVGIKIEFLIDHIFQGIKLQESYAKNETSVIDTLQIDGSGRINGYDRVYSWENNRVLIGGSRRMWPEGSGVDYSVLIPLRIYGIKEVQ